MGVHLPTPRKKSSSAKAQALIVQIHLHLVSFYRRQVTSAAQLPFQSNVNLISRRAEQLTNLLVSFAGLTWQKRLN